MSLKQRKLGVSPRQPPSQIHAIAPDHLDVLWHLDCVVSPRSPFTFRSTSYSSSSSLSSSPTSAGSPNYVKQLSMGISNNARQSMARVFRAFDENGDGKVTTAELCRMFEKLGIPYNRTGAKSMNHDEVNEDEFVRLLMSHLDDVDADATVLSQCRQHEETSQEHHLANELPQCGGSTDSEEEHVDEEAAEEQVMLLRVAFRVFDKDQDGFIGPIELQHVLHSLGFEEASDLASCKCMIERFDLNNDGRIDFMEFAAMMQSFSFSN